MNILRKVLALLLASVAVVLSLPALAASGTKYVSFQFPAIIPSPVGGVVTLDVPVTNDSTPPGVSTINSMRLSVSGLNGVCIASVSFQQPSQSLSRSPATGCVPMVTLSDFTGIRRGETAILRLTLNNVANAVCTPLTWTASANAGNSLNGDAFLDSPTNPSKLLSRAGCDGILSCLEAPTGGVPSFDGSTLSAGLGQSGFFAGDRYIKNGDCPLAYYRTTNTIGSAGATVDGYILGTNNALISYVVPGDSILLAHTITFAPVWSNTQGLFDPARITYCKKLTSGTTDCTGTPFTNPSVIKVAQGCLNPAIAMTSIPFIGTEQEPGCVRAWATEIVAPVAPVLPATEDTCGGVARPAGGNRACMLVSIDVLEGQDPPWGMTDE